MRSVRRLCFPSALLLFVAAGMAPAQQPAATPYSIANAAQTASVSRTAGSRDHEAAEIRGLSTVLPRGVAPNPPNPADLKRDKRIWRGEYELDRTGRILLGPDAKPVPVLYNLKGKRMKSKVKLPKTHPISIADGTLTVDGWAGKARLHYDIPDLRFIYFSVPNVGTVIVSQTAFPGSEEEKGAFDREVLTVRASNHLIQLTSSKVLLGQHPRSAYVKVDHSFYADGRWPSMGYGSALVAPYEWPGAKQQAAEVADAPPLPVEMRPKLAAPVCISQKDRECAVTLVRNGGR